MVANCCLKRGKGVLGSGQDQQRGSPPFFLILFLVGLAEILERELERLLSGLHGVAKERGKNAALISEGENLLALTDSVAEGASATEFLVGGLVEVRLLNVRWVDGRRDALVGDMEEGGVLGSSAHVVEHNGLLGGVHGSVHVEDHVLRSEARAPLDRRSKV